MSELCSPKTHFSSPLISDLVLLCSFILSHPLYFSYFIFFSPYLLKLVSFLSPLFITTFLLFLAFLTGIVHENFSNELVQSRVSHFLVVLERLRSKKDEEFLESLDDLGMYEILFGSLVVEVGGSQVEVLEEKSEEEDPLQGCESVSDKEDLSICRRSVGLAVDELKMNPSPDGKLENSGQEKRLENFLRILDEFERMASNVETKVGTKTDRVVEKPKVGSLVRIGSEAATGNKITTAAKVSFNNSNGGKEYTTSPMVKAHSQRISSNAVDHNDEDEERGHPLKVESCRALDHSSLGSYGSMRKEKEWKRTLACKLFEERHNDGGEGMDSLWEAYEMDSKKSVRAQNNGKMKKNKKKSKIEENYENEIEEEIDGQLCCLQALKLSAGKMNLSMGRPNLVKISKAFKGIGWLHHVTKHSKKVHNNGDRY